MEIAVIVIVIIAAILFILLINYIIHLKFERKFRERQEAETLRWQAEEGKAAQ